MRNNNILKEELNVNGLEYIGSNYNVFGDIGADCYKLKDLNALTSLKVDNTPLTIDWLEENYIENVRYYWNIEEDSTVIRNECYVFTKVNSAEVIAFSYRDGFIYFYELYGTHNTLRLNLNFITISSDLSESFILPLYLLDNILRQNDDYTILPNGILINESTAYYAYEYDSLGEPILKIGPNLQENNRSFWFSLLKSTSSSAVQKLVFLEDAYPELLDTLSRLSMYSNCWQSSTWSFFGGSSKTFRDFLTGPIDKQSFASYMARIYKNFLFGVDLETLSTLSVKNFNKEQLSKLAYKGLEDMIWSVVSKNPTSYNLEEVELLNIFIAVLSDIKILYATNEFDELLPKLLEAMQKIKDLENSYNNENSKYMNDEENLISLHNGKMVFEKVSSSHTRRNGTASKDNKQKVVLNDAPYLKLINIDLNKYSNNDKILIPKEINNLPVKVIGEYILSGENSFTGTIIIPDSIELIEKYAFYGFSGSIRIDIKSKSDLNKIFFDTGALALSGSSSYINRRKYSIRDWLHNVGDLDTKVKINYLYTKER